MGIGIKRSRRVAQSMSSCASQDAGGSPARAASGRSM